MLSRSTLSWWSGLSLAAALAASGCASHARSRAASPRPAPAVTPRAREAAFGPAAIDAALREAWAKRGVRPAPAADDATFLRRVTVDLIGTVPTESEARAFIDSKDPHKRAAWIDRALASPAFAEHWALYWDTELMGRRTPGALVDRDAFRSWLRARIADNTPWSQLVAEVVAATGVNSRGGPLAQGRGPVLDVMEEPDDAAAGDDAAPVHGAVNWTLRFQSAPEDIAGTASRVFLGVQIQCAQCHDHKTEKWTTEDFRSLTSAFWHVSTRPLDRTKPMKMHKRVEVVDAKRVPPRYANNPALRPIAGAAPKALDGTRFGASGKSVRAELAAWMTSPKNPWFARAAVNRMWGHFLGRGFVDPVDDMRASNPPELPELLDRIAEDFVKSGFDMRHLMRTICLTEAYGLSSSASGAPDRGNHLWGKFHLVPLGQEALLRALLRATDAEEAARRANLDVERLRTQLVRQYGFLFDVDEDSDAAEYAGTVSQALMLLNGAFVGHASRALPGSALDDVLGRSGDDAARVEALYLRVLSRRPTPVEISRSLDYVHHATHRSVVPRGRAAAGPKGQGPLGRLARKGGPPDARREAWEDIMWSLLNSSEFLFNH